MKPLAIVGIILIVLGIVGLAVGRFSYTTEEKVVDVGPIEATVDEEHHIAIPDVASDAEPRWYALSADDLCTKLSVDVDTGLTADAAAAALAKNGPNALPEEKPEPGWRRFLDEYRSFMQIVLVGAAIVSVLIQEWSTALLLVILTIVNAVIGLREEGKAASAMNALKSMMKADARVRRGGDEQTIPADQVVVGDVVFSRPEIRSPRTAGSCRPVPCRSTSPPSPARASPHPRVPSRSPLTAMSGRATRRTWHS